MWGSGDSPLAAYRGKLADSDGERVGFACGRVCLCGRFGLGVNGGEGDEQDGQDGCASDTIRQSNLLIIS